MRDATRPAQTDMAVVVWDKQMERRRLFHAIVITIFICTSGAALAQSDDPNALQRGSVNFFKLGGTMRLLRSGNATWLRPVPGMGSSM